MKSVLTVETKKIKTAERRRKWQKVVKFRTKKKKGKECKKGIKTSKKKILLTSLFDVFARSHNFTSCLEIKKFLDTLFPPSLPFFHG